MGFRCTEPPQTPHHWTLQGTSTGADRGGIKGSQALHLVQVPLGRSLLSSPNRLRVGTEHRRAGLAGTARQQVGPPSQLRDDRPVCRVACSIVLLVRVETAVE